MPQIEETALPVNGEPARTPWGVGRIALFARLDAITSDLAAGWPMTAIYKRHMTGLGISYSAFRKLVRRHANDFRPGHREPAPARATRPGQRRIVPTRLRR